MRCRASLASTVALAVAWLGGTGSAAAEVLSVPSGQQVLLPAGSHLRDEIIIAGTLRVPPVDDETGGWIELKALRIVIEADGRIDASGVGYPGTTGTGPGFGDASGSGIAPAPEELNGELQPSPGGGGAHLGAGAPGVDGSCALFSNSNGLATGGVAYDDVANPLGIAGLGSPGGGSHAGVPNIR